MQRRFTSSRRHFLASGACVAVAASPAMARVAQFTMKLGHDAPASHPLGVAANEFAEAVRRESNGRLDIRVFSDNTLGEDASMIAQLRSGALEMSLQGIGPLSAVAPIAAIGYVGFSFQTRQQGQAAMDGGVGALIRASLDTIGIHCFETSWGTGFREIGCSTHPIRTVDDLSGLKIRVPSSPTSLDLFKTLGASPVPLGFGQLYTSLQTHLIDSVDGTYASFYAQKLFEVQKYLSITNHQWVPYFLLANGAAWSALPTDLQTIVQKNARVAALREGRALALQEIALIDLLGRDGMVMNYPDTRLFRARLDSYYARWKKEFGATAWTVLERYTGTLG